MAEIRDDHIKCDKSDPWLKIRIPARLLYWVDEAADYRGISTEELVNELLYDYYGKTYNAKGELQRLHIHERRRRRQMTVRRYALRTESHKNGKTLTPLDYLRKNDRVDWAKLEELRRQNLKMLEHMEYNLNQPRKELPTSELEAVRTELEKRGIKRNFIRINKVDVWLRPRKREGGKAVLPPRHEKPLRANKKGDYPGTVVGPCAESLELIAQVKEVCAQVGATKVLERIIEEERLRDEELRVRRLTPKNHTK